MSCELIDFIMQSMLCELREQAFGEAELERISKVVLPSVTEKTISIYGGDKIYIPKRSEHHTISETLAKQYNGHNIAEISKNMKVSRRTVYRAIQIQRAKQKNQR